MPPPIRPSPDPNPRSDHQEAEHAVDAIEALVARRQAGPGVCAQAAATTAEAQAARAESELPAGVAAFVRLAALVPAGSWPVTLPTTPELPVRPLQVGVRERVAALLPAKHHEALANALRRHCRSRRYLEACAAPDAARWGDGGEPVGPVSEPDRARALRLLGRQGDA